MPSAVSKRNAILQVAIGIFAITAGCGERLGVEVVLLPPAAPDPFVDVARLRVSVDLDRGVETLAEVRWDQGPVSLPIVSNPAIRRIVVEGLTDTGRIVASGASQALDLLAEPPDAPIPVHFTKVGVISQWSNARSPRLGGRAVPVSGGRWLAVGGLDDSGCPREDTELFGPELDRVQSGPPLPGGRSGHFHALSLIGGDVLVLGGSTPVGCPSAVPQAPWRLTPTDGRSVRGEPLDWPSGAAVAVMSESLVLAAGGFGTVTAQADVFGLDPRTFQDRRVGSLSIPRARGVLVALGARRALMLGGQARTSTDSALLDASVFEPSRGATLDERIDVGSPVIDGPAIRTAAGSVIVLGTDPGSDRSEVKAVVVQPDRAVPLGDVTRVSVATSTLGNALMSLADGSLLLFRSDGLDWIQLLPRQVVDVPSETGSLFGGVLGDGLALLLAPDGRRSTFNPGPAAILGWRGPAGALQAREGPSIGVGLVPRRPGRWQLTTEGLEGTHISDGADLGEWVVAVDRTWGDFSLTLDGRATSGARLLIVWGADADQFSYLEVGTQLQVGRFGGRAPECATVTGPGRTDEGWSAGIRVRREGGRVIVEQRAGPILECTDLAREGWLGVGVAAGTATIRRVVVGLP